LKLQHKAIIFTSSDKNIFTGIILQKPLLKVCIWDWKKSKKDSHYVTEGGEGKGGMNMMK